MMKPGTLPSTAFAALLALGQAGCCSRFPLAKPVTGIHPKKEMTFSEDVTFLKKHVDVITLGQGEVSPQVAVVPAYQGRVPQIQLIGGIDPHRLDAVSRTRTRERR